MSTAVHAIDPRFGGILKTVAREHGGVPVVLVLDYDGTLAPIVADPSAAVMVPGLVPVLRAATSRSALAAGLRVVVVSGRSVDKVRAFLAPLGPASLAAIRIAGSHGYDIQPAVVEGGTTSTFTAFPGHAPLLKNACALLLSSLAANPIPGASVEDNVFSVSLHYRNTPQEHHGAVQRLAEAVNAAVNASGGPTLEVRPGKAVWELRPAVAWGKGHALRHLVESGFFRENGGSSKPVLIVAGDDATDGGW
jgi:trehalose-phosphatase